MAPKHRNTTPQTTHQPVAAVAITATAAHPVSTASTSGPVLGAKKQQGSWDQVVSNLVNHYVKNTPQRTKLIDAFMAFLVAVGALQFLYCVLAGNYVRILYITCCRDGEEDEDMISSGNRQSTVWNQDKLTKPRATKTALQRLPLRLLSNSRPVRSYRLATDPNRRGEQGRFPFGVSREVCYMLWFWSRLKGSIILTCTSPEHLPTL